MATLIGEPQVAAGTADDLERLAASVQPARELGDPAARGDPADRRVATLVGEPDVPVGPGGEGLRHAPTAQTAAVLGQGAPRGQGQAQQRAVAQAGAAIVGEPQVAVGSVRRAEQVDQHVWPERSLADRARSATRRSVRLGLAVAVAVAVAVASRSCSCSCSRSRSRRQRMRKREPLRARLRSACPRRASLRVGRACWVGARGCVRRVWRGSVRRAASRCGRRYRAGGGWAETNALALSLWPRCAQLWAVCGHSCADLGSRPSASAPVSPRTPSDSPRPEPRRAAPRGKVSKARAFTPGSVTYECAARKSVRTSETDPRLGRFCARSAQARAERPEAESPGRGPWRGGRNRATGEREVQGPRARREARAPELAL